MKSPNYFSKFNWVQLLQISPNKKSFRIKSERRTEQSHDTDSTLNLKTLPESFQFNVNCRHLKNKLPSFIQKLFIIAA
jgi:hypothetical protein